MVYFLVVKFEVTFLRDLRMNPEKDALVPHHPRGQG